MKSEHLKICVEKIDVEAGLTRRDREQLKVRNMLDRILPGAKLGHRDSGAPYIIGDPEIYVSVSHSREYAALALSDSPVGIDIEEPREQLMRVAPRFLSARELEIFDTPRKLLLAWTATEALYKIAHTIADEPGVIRLREDINLKNLNYEHDNECLEASVHDKSFTVKFTTFGKNILAVASLKR